MNGYILNSVLHFSKKNKVTAVEVSIDGDNVEVIFEKSNLLCKAKTIRSFDYLVNKFSKKGLYLSWDIR